MIKNKKKEDREQLINNQGDTFNFIINKYPFFIFLILSLTIAAIVFKDFFFGEFLYYFKDIGSDSVNITLPNYVQGVNLQKSDGYLRFWSFYSGMGQAYPNGVTLSPFVLIKVLLFKIFGMNLWFYRIYIIYFLYILPAGIVAFYYFKTLNYSNLTAIIGGLLFQFSGYMIVGSQWGHAFKIFNFIFLIFSFEQILLKKRWWIFPIAIYLISDNFFLLAANVLFLLIYSFVRYIDVNDGKLKGYFMLLLKMAGFGLLAVLINAPRGVSNFLMMYLTPRVVGEVTQAKHLMIQPETIDNSLRRITTILRFFGNDLLGTGSDFKGWNNYLEAALFYIGLISLLLMPLALFFMKKQKRVIYGIWLAFWLLVAFIPILRHGVNFFVGNYFKNTIDVFVPFVVLFLAMFSFEKIQKEENINPLLLVITTGILLVLLFFPYFEFTNSIVDFNKKLVASLFILTYSVLVYLFAAKKKTELLSVLIVFLVVVELTSVAWTSINNRDVYLKNELVTGLAGYNDETISALDYIKENDSTKFYRIEKDFSSGNSEHASLNDAKAQNYFGTTSYSSFNQINYIGFLKETEIIERGNEGQTRWCLGVRGIPLMMTFASVKYYLTKDIDNKLKYSGYDSLGVFDGIMILENKHFLPLGYKYEKYLPFSEFQNLSPFKKQQALLMAIVIGENINPEILTKLDTNVLVNIESFNLSVYSLMIDSLKQNTFEITKFKNKRIDGNVKIDKAGFLFFSIPYDKGWKVYVNGKEQKIIPSNIGFFSVYLNSGEYKLTLKYRPPYFKITLLVASLALVILLLIILLMHKKQK